MWQSSETYANVAENLGHWMGFLTNGLLHFVQETQSYKLAFPLMLKHWGCVGGWDISIDYQEPV